MASGLFYLYQMDESISQQELSSDNIARLDELKGGCNVKSVDLLFRSWMWQGTAQSNFGPLSCQI